MSAKTKPKTRRWGKKKRRRLLHRQRRKSKTQRWGKKKRRRLLCRQRPSPKPRGGGRRKEEDFYVGKDQAQNPEVGEEEKKKTSTSKKRRPLWNLVPDNPRCHHHQVLKHFAVTCLRTVMWCASVCSVQNLASGRGGGGRGGHELTLTRQLRSYCHQLRAKYVVLSSSWIRTEPAYVIEGTEMDLEPTWMTDLILEAEHQYQRGSDHVKTLYNFTRCMPILSDHEIHILCTVCQSHGTYRFLAMAAIHYGKVEEVFTQELCHSLNVAFWDQLYTFLASRFLWSTVKKLLSLCPAGHFKTLLRVLARSVTLNHEEKDVFGMLVERCSGSRAVWLKDALNAVTSGGHFQQFQILMSTDDKDTRQAIVEGFSEVPYLAELIFQACRIRRSVGVSQRVTGYNHCLSLACEAGAFSALVTLKSNRFPDEEVNSVLGIAVVSNQPDLVRLLHSVGASTNSEIYQLSQHPQLKKRSSADEGQAQRPLNSFPHANDAGAAREIRDFLTSKASQPCSLLRLSLLEVSKHVGWGHCRQAIVNRLGIPHNLNDLLMFKDSKSLLKG